MASSAPVRPIGRVRRRRATGTVVVVAVLVLLGRGLGWFGAAQPGPSSAANAVAAVPEDRQEAMASAGSAVAAAPGGAGSPQVPTPAHPPAVPAGDVAVAPAATDSPDAASQPDAAGAPDPAPSANLEVATNDGRGLGDPVASDTPIAGTLDPDRFAARLSVLQRCLDEGRFGAALATLTQLAAQPLDGAQQVALVAPRQQLADGLAVGASQVVAQLAQGDVLAAHAAITVLASDGEAFVHDALQQALRAAGVEVALLGPGGAAGEPLPIARPLPRGRELRVRTRAGIVAGRVVDSRSDRLTVRIEGTAGVAFPSVSTVDVEPVQPSADEAVELGFAALQAGDVRLARAWLVCAQLRARENVPERLPRLASALP